MEKAGGPARQQKYPEIGGQEQAHGTSRNGVHDQARYQDDRPNLPHPVEQPQVDDIGRQDIIETGQQKDLGLNGRLENDQHQTDPDMEQVGHLLSPGTIFSGAGRINKSSSFSKSTKGATVIV